MDQCAFPLKCGGLERRPSSSFFPPTPSSRRICPCRQRAMRLRFVRNFEVPFEPPGPAFTNISDHASPSTARPPSSSQSTRTQIPPAGAVGSASPSAPAPQYNQRELDYLNSLQTGPTTSPRSHSTSQSRSVWVTRAASTQFNAAAVNSSLAQQQQTQLAQQQAQQQSQLFNPSSGLTSPSRSQTTPTNSTSPNESPRSNSSGEKKIDFSSVTQSPFDDLEPPTPFKPLAASSGLPVNTAVVAKRQEVSAIRKISSRSGDSALHSASINPSPSSSSAQTSHSASASPAVPPRSLPLSPSTSSLSLSAASSNSNPNASTMPPRSVAPSNLPPPPKSSTVHSPSASSVPAPSPQPSAATSSAFVSPSKPSLVHTPSASSVLASAPQTIPPLPAPPSPTHLAPPLSPSHSPQPSPSPVPMSMQSLPSNPVWPRVQLLSCGGTIAQRSSDDGRGMLLNALPPAELLAQTKANVNWSQRTICQSSGAAMTFQSVFALRDHIVDAQNEFDGFVITTGTDSGEEVAFLLDRLLYGHVKVSVVVTGAMKPSDITGYDGPANVEAAARVAVNATSKTLGVLFVENNAIHAARYVVKSDSTRIGAFHSRSGGPLGYVRSGRVIYHYTGLPPHAYRVPLSINESALSRFKVAIWTMTLDAYFPEIMLHEVDGLVIAGQGTGSISNGILNTLASYTSSVRMAMATRCESGSNFDDWYYKGSLDKYEKLGIEVAAFEGLSPQQTRLALMLNMATGLS